ncbi:hypothetical protein CLU83_2594 [Flavobacterium sp. 1]|nr:hypothetical protein CLU83_2594 [Flavobacterium sp. 1]
MIFVENILEKRFGTKNPLTNINILKELLLLKIEYTDSTIFHSKQFVESVFITFCFFNEPFLDSQKSTPNHSKLIFRFRDAVFLDFLNAKESAVSNSFHF